MADKSSLRKNLSSDPGTLFVGNLPRTATNEELEKTFNDIGLIKRCFIVKDKGVGFITFARNEDAKSAIDKVITFSGRELRLRFAKAKFATKPQMDKIGGIESPGKVLNDKAKGRAKTACKKAKLKTKVKSLKYKDKMVVRNISYGATEEDLRKAFEKHGHVVYVHLPKHPSGRLLGYGFVRMRNEQESSDAIAGVNSQEILGRPVAVDWAISQKAYQDIKRQERTPEKVLKHALKCNADNDECKASVKGTQTKKKVKKSSNACIDDVSDTEEDTNESDFSLYHEEGNMDTNDVEMSDMESSGEDGTNLSYEDGDENLDMTSDDKDGHKIHKTDNKNKNSDKYSDTKEGKTIFVRNISFDTTEDQFKEAFSQFGELQYVTICIDSVTGHSKGSGFVKFASKASAEDCLSKTQQQSGKGGITLDGQKLLVNIALSREEMTKCGEDKMKMKKDKRNLYLAREGLIRPGSQAANGVSKQDMNKRMQLEEWRRKKLTNLHIFIAKTRLSVTNIPLSMSENTLRCVFEKAGGPGARLREVKIMRSWKTLSAAGIGKSLGFGFIRFDEHEHALRALRATNNNPDVFTPSSRPIVEFTLENQAALKAKERRLENSRRKNKQIQESKKRDINPDKHEAKGKIPANSNIIGSNRPFVGTKSESLDRLKSKNLPSHFGPKIRHKQRPSAVVSKVVQSAHKIHKRKREERLATQTKQRNRKEMPPLRKVQKLHQSEDNLDRLINTYQKKAKPNEKRENGKRKWFKSRD